MLTGKVALVTGASRGIGLATARLFAANHASLHVCARSESLVATAQDLEVTSGIQVTPHLGDIRDVMFIRDLFGRIKKAGRGLDILVNNAGVVQQNLLGMIPMEQTRETMEINLIGLINSTQFAVRLMKSGASIINVASIAGTRGMEGTAAYAASKGGVLGFTLAIAKELAGKNIRVNALAPGFIDTDMTRALPQAWFQKRLDSIGMGRIGTPEDVAKVALFLASDLSGYMTGQVLGVDGGMVS